MFNNEDLPRPKPVLLIPPLLDKLSVAELDEYVGLLREEIVRVEADKAKKEAWKKAAADVFKS